MLRRKILERRRRPLVQPHQMDAVINLFQRDAEIIGVAAHRGQQRRSGMMPSVNFDSTRKAIS